MTVYHIIYQNLCSDTCYTTYHADDLDHVWEQWRNGDRDPEDKVLMIFVGTVDQVLYQE